MAKPQKKPTAKPRNGLAFVARVTKSGGGVHHNKTLQKKRLICRGKINLDNY